MALVSHEEHSFFERFDVVVVVTVIVFGGAEGKFIFGLFIGHVEAFGGRFGLHEIDVLDGERKFHFGIAELLEDRHGLVVDHHTVRGAGRGEALEVGADQVHVSFEDDATLIGLGVLGVAQGTDAGCFILFFGGVYFGGARLGVTRSCENFFALARFLSGEWGFASTLLGLESPSTNFGTLGPVIHNDPVTIVTFSFFIRVYRV